MARLALASEKPDTCTGLPRLPSPQGAEQEARMDTFIPDGYLTLRAAIEHMAAIIHGEKLVSLSEQEKQDLAFLDPQQGQPDEVVEVSQLSADEFQRLKSKSAEVAEQQEAAQDLLRQFLFADQLGSQVLHHDGRRHDISNHGWGGDDGRNTLSSGKIGVGSDMGSVTGLVIIKANALEAAFNPNEAVKEEPEPVSPEPMQEEPTKQSNRGRPPEWPRETWLECLLLLALQGRVNLADSQESMAEELATEVENITGKKPSVGTVKKDWLRPILKKAKQGEISNK